MKETAGTLLHRHAGKKLEVLLVHAAGNYNKKSPWSIPKGLPDPGETMEEAARRETYEEAGIVAGPLQPLGFVDYKKSRKRIHCFVGEAPVGAQPHCASWEVDRAEFVRLDEARVLLHPDQRAFLDRLIEHLAG